MGGQSRYRCSECDKPICMNCWNKHHLFIGAVDAVMTAEMCAPCPFPGPDSAAAG